MKKIYLKSRNLGFTLIEILLVIGIMFSIMLFKTQDLKNENNISSAKILSGK